MLKNIQITLPENFLQEEVRCGYTVTSDMKKVWAVELDLLVRLLEVCRKHNISIVASGGTLLGAVRHKGFIPWDDDIDLMMTRSEYERLCQVAQKEFTHPYFFQTEYTDPGSLRGHAQLRNSETTAILESERGKARFNQGIFIDIFPLDNVIDDPEKLWLQYKASSRYLKKAKKCNRFTYGYKRKDGIAGFLRHCLYHVISPYIARCRLQEYYYSLFENECSRYNNESAHVISSLSFQFLNKKNYIATTYFSKIIMLDFEFIQIPSLEKYESYLITHYGDYKKFVLGESCHGKVFFDTDNSYAKYLNQF